LRAQNKQADRVGPAGIRGPGRGAGPAPRRAGRAARPARDHARHPL